MTQDAIYQLRTDRYHGGCLTEALKADATTVPLEDIDDDEECATCEEPLKGEAEIDLDLDDEDEIEDTDDEPVKVRTELEGDEGLRG